MRKSCTPFDPLVDTETGIFIHNYISSICCTPFDPLVDTETPVSPAQHQPAGRCTPFDPLVDTETPPVSQPASTTAPLHPLRSACGY